MIVWSASSWCVVRDGAEWGVSLGDGFNPRQERYLACGDRTDAVLMLLALRMGLGGVVGVA